MNHSIFSFIIGYKYTVVNNLLHRDQNNKNLLIYFLGKHYALPGI